MSARRDPAGLVTMPAKPCIMIPSALRRRCGLLPGDRVLLAMFPGQDAMAAYSFAVVDEALLCHGLFAQLRVAEGLAMAGAPAQLAAAYLRRPGRARYETNRRPVMVFDEPSAVHEDLSSAFRW